ncbi:MAG: phosphatidate cytidylyltransferase [Ferruginibacter sp.]|nr:phosphatidate cytidylyltransferase [Ferruginibacter sp.]
MALNIQTFKTRSLSAIVFVLIVFSALFINGYVFTGFFLLVGIGCMYEYLNLLKKIKTNGYSWWLIAGLLYITLPVLCLIDLGTSILENRTLDNYSALFPCMVIFSMWINDTMAYIVGSFIGKTQLSKISPKKTWEGTLGGIILCIGVVSIFGLLYPNHISAKQAAILAAICAIAGTFGDLLESKLKRMANVKDSGNIMPGHGGFLDRFDSLLLAAPCAWIYVKWLM